jgi:hypothetical protein
LHPWKRDRDDWLACIPNAHPGYISWERFQENLKILKSNDQGYEAARASPQREGAALLQGRAVCGLCGKNFRIRHTARRRRLDAQLRRREHAIRNHNVSFKEVTASRGKIARAEPISALYEQSKVRHAGSFVELEDQLAAMTCRKATSATARPTVPTR